MEERAIQLLPDTPASVMHLMPATQAQVDRFSDELIRSVKEGETNPLQLRATIKATEMVLERVNKETQAEQLREADKYPGDKFEAFGCTMQKGDTWTAYDYASCGDPVWKNRKEIVDEAISQLKDREAFLKTLKQPMTFVHEESGEIVTIQPPVKKSVAGLKVSIK